jgi:hypothetical protein
VSVSAQRQALNTLVLFSWNVLHPPRERQFAPAHSICHPRRPTALTQPEVQQLLGAVTGKLALMTGLRSSRGLRVQCTSSVAGATTMHDC